MSVKDLRKYAFNPPYVFLYVIYFIVEHKNLYRRSFVIIVELFGHFENTSIIYFLWKHRNTCSDNEEMFLNEFPLTAFLLFSSQVQ